MKICILENDTLDLEMANLYESYSSMFKNIFQSAGVNWEYEVFNTKNKIYPESFEKYDAVLLTGSKYDSFSNEDWIVKLREVVTSLLFQKKKLIGICFGHQLIAYCLGAKVERASQGWGIGRMLYQWHDANLAPEFRNKPLALLASHQDQVTDLPPNTKLLASSLHCPIAGYTIDKQVFCVQAHPEFTESYSHYLIGKRRNFHTEKAVYDAVSSLKLGHDGAILAGAMVRFVENS
jgi:GMP synthase-like glutamine amidotransferase